jgi:hypothetical protein
LVGVWTRPDDYGGYLRGRDRRDPRGGPQVRDILRRYDVILSATLPAPPPKLGYFDMYGDVEVINKRVSEYLSIHAAPRCRWLASSANNIVLPSLAAWSARVIC